ASLTQLMEHVAYLLEENRSFQELFARLVNHVESGGTVTNGSLAKKKGFVLEQPFTERIVQNEIVETRNMTDTQDDAQFHDAQVAAAADQPDSTDASDDSS